jgi:hypothetical protein
MIIYLQYVKNGAISFSNIDFVRKIISFLVPLRPMVSITSLGVIPVVLHRTSIPSSDNNSSNMGIKFLLL